MKKQFLLILDGMTGAGKTSVARLLADDMPRTAVIGMDKVKRFISDFERGVRDNRIAKEITFEMAKKYLDNNISVIIEQSFKSESEIKEYEKLAKKYAVSLYKFQLFATPKIAFQRVLSRQESSNIKVPKKHIKFNIGLFKNKKDKGFFIIDTSDISSEEVQKIILKIIKLC